MHRQIILHGFGWVSQNKARRTLVFFAQHIDDGRTRAFILETLNFYIVQQPGKVCEQPFQSYAFRSIKWAFQPLHEITLQQKKYIFGHQWLPEL